MTKTRFTPRDVSDAERRARIGLMLRQASNLLVAARSDLHIEDYHGDAPVGYGQFDVLLSKLGDVQENIRQGPDT